MSERSRVLLVGVVVVAALVAGGIWWFLRDNAPEKVSLENAVEQVATTTTVADGGTDTAGPGSSTTDGSAAGIEGSWTIDTETGEFDYETATGTFAGFRIDEELASIGSTEAVGRTGDVTGSMTIEGTTLTEASFEVDLSTITTNESRRDDRVQSALDTGQFPTATFTLTAPVELGDGAAAGDAVTATLAGDLTIHGVTKSVEFDLEAQLVNGTVVAVGSTKITFSDFEVEVPSSPAVLSVSDEGTIELQFLLTQG